MRKKGLYNLKNKNPWKEFLKEEKAFNYGRKKAKAKIWQKSGRSGGM